MPSLAELEREALVCTKCPLAGGRTQVVFGVGDPNADLMFVGEAPGREEDLKGEPFVGRSGKLLDKLVLEEMGLTREQFYIGNVLQMPASEQPRSAARRDRDRAGRTSSSRLEIIAPKVIVTLGNFATKLLLNTTEGITKVRGRTYPYGKATLVPTYHPAAALQGGGSDVLARMRADLVRAKQAMGPPAERQWSA